MHVASLARYEAGSLATPEAGIDVDRIRAYVASRLHRVPRYRQRLAWTPIERHPVWMDDHRFDLEYHVCHAALPKPGDERQLKALVARLMAEHLDRERPLWEMWIIEALDAGRWFAVLTKLHHCMVDGISAVDMLTALMRPEPRVEIDPAPAWTPRPAPNRWQLGGESLARWAGLPIDAAKEVPGLLASLHDPRSEVRTRIRVVRDTLAGAFRSYSPSPTPFNGPVGRHRRVDWAEMDLAALRAVKGAAGGTLNDVVLAVVTGAVRRFLERRGANVAGLDFACSRRSACVRRTSAGGSETACPRGWFRCRSRNGMPFARSLASARRQSASRRRSRRSPPRRFSAPANGSRRRSSTSRRRARAGECRSKSWSRTCRAPRPRFTSSTRG